VRAAGLLDPAARISAAYQGQSISEATSMSTTMRQGEPGLKPGILIVDDYLLIQESLTAFLEKAGFVVLSGASQGAEAIQMAAKLRPAIALVDLSKPLLSGINTAIGIHRSSPLTKMILLADEDADALQSAPAGMAGYITKRKVRDLLEAIRQIQRGYVYFSEGFTAASFQSTRTEPDPRRGLTAREWQILQLIAEGRGTREISTVLQMAPNTALAHRANLMQKLNVHNVAPLVRMAVRWGLVSVGA
jgi:DNA-binding NarL/FixJ family response regulator